ncbi:glycosyltransferase family 9 protein [Sulfuricurvum sp.]|uniref:glycosyltransferase family 9 protein n=1 Tax=Sulfuricurvum sp. TaxID=2025608 RepID=UPI00356446EE
MFSKLKTAIKLIVYYFINLSLSPSKELKQKSILLIRLDAIGDYILFRNFIEVLRNSEQYKDYKITLIGNNAWKSLAEELDSEYIDEFIWLERDKFLKDFIYRYLKLKEITSKGYTIVLSPAYSREFLMGDTIVNLVNANEKIGSIGDLSNIREWQKNISDKYYTKLIKANNKLLFEFYRNKEFFENLLQIKLDISKSTIKLKEKNLTFELPQKYAILFIGASSDFRKWSIERFAKAAKYLKEKYNYEIVLCGATTDKIDAAKFKKYFDGECVDLVGKTSLVELLYVIHNGNLIIANETSAPHAAIALGDIKTFVISNGNHYGRFTPYPKEIAPNYYAVYHPLIEQDLGNYQKLSNSYGFGSDLDINEISVESVMKKINEKSEEENP